MSDKLMKSTGGEYAPVFVSDATGEPPMIHAVEIDAPSDEYVEVAAPASLAPGYELTVDVDGGHWVVLVPSGGVQEGELFRAKVLRKSSLGLINPTTSTKKDADLHKIPVGRWRDGLCDCCVMGCCHAHLCLAWCCAPCALGQVMTRMNLSPFADPYLRGTSHTRRWTTCRIMSLVYFVMIVVLYSLAIAVTPHPYVDQDGVVHHDPKRPSPFWTLVYHLLAVSWTIYLLLAICKTRAYVRQTYGIPETSCRGCEDCCCSYWCPCCTISQMARHTADYRTYHGACCSSTGLGEGAPPTLAPHLV